LLKEEEGERKLENPKRNVEKGGRPLFVSLEGSLENPSVEIL